MKKKLFGNDASYCFISYSPPPLMIFISFGFIKTETGAKTTPLATKWVTKAAGDAI